MGDILGSIFGTSSTTTQQTIPDPISQQLNQWRLQQYQDLLNSGSLREFGDPHSEYYNTTPETDSLIRGVSDVAGTPLDYSNLLSLDNYQRSFDPVTQSYRQGVDALNNTTASGLAGAQQAYQGTLAGLGEQYGRGINRSYSDFDTGVASAGQTYRQGSADVNAAYDAAIQRGDYDLALSLDIARQGGDRALALNESLYQRGIDTNSANLLASLNLSGADAQRSLATQDANRARALELGLNSTGNYIDQIARPRLEQVLALQGLERGGALPAAIARATAETAMPYLQSIENTYGTNQANTLNALTALRGELTGNRTALDAALAQQLMGLQTGVNTNTQNLQTGAATSAAGANANLGGQRLNAQASLADSYQNNVAQLAQALMANNISLEQAGITANSALGQQLMQTQATLRTQQQQGITSLANTYGSNATNFTTSLPGASQALSLIPGQMQAGRAATLTALQPLADFPRQLQEADFLRRQGLFTTAYTGIPYTPGGTVAGGSATGNIFDQLGGTIQSGLKGGGNINT